MEENNNKNKKLTKQEAFMTIGGAFTFMSSLVDLIGIISSGAKPFSVFRGLGMSSHDLSTYSNDVGPLTATANIATIGGGISITEGTNVPIGRVGGVVTYQNSSGDYNAWEKKDTEKIEENANNIYNTFNKEHESICNISGVIIKSAEDAETFKRITNSKKRRELYYELSGLKEILTEMSDEEKQEHEEGKKLTLTK